MVKRKFSDLQITYNPKTKRRKITKVKRRIPRSLVGYVRTTGMMKYVGRSELKFLDTTLNTTAITTAGVIINNTINNIVEGSDFNERIGRKVNITSIHFRGAYLEEAQTTLANMSNNVRIIIYLDQQCNAAAATVTDVLASADEKSFNNLNNSERFKILKDWFFTINHTAQSVLTGPVYSTHRVQKTLIWNKKCDIPLKFNATNGGTVADLTSNNIGILGIAQSANGGSLDVGVRIRFRDM